MYDFIIVGGGPAGTAAAVYAARKQMKTLLLTEGFGGQSVVSADIQNWIGDQHIGGAELAKKFEEHVRSFSDVVDVKMPEKVTAVRKINCVNGSRSCDFEVETDKGNKYTGKTLMLASGARRRRLGVPGEDKFDGKGVAFCSTCLPPDEKIIANSSVKEISEIKRDQSVLTIDGSFQKVSRIMNRPYQGELVEINTRFFTEPTVLTSNHPVLAVNVAKGVGPNYWRDFRISDPVWIPAGELTENHSVLYPVIKETKDIPKITLADVLDWGLKLKVNDSLAYYRHGSPTAHKINNEIAIDANFMRLAGYYIAEGTLSGKGINFYFSKYEKECIKDTSRIVEKLFGLKPTLKVENSVMRVEVYSEIIEDLFFKLFGKYAHNKRLPHWMIFLPRDKQAELIKGIYRGDGCKREKDFCIVTNSKTLAYQLRDIFLRLGILPGIQKRDKNKLNEKPGMFDGRVIRFNHDKYHITIGGPSLDKMSQILGVSHEKISLRKRIRNHARLKDGQVVLPIRSIKRIPYEGQVHNLSVEVNNTYVAKNFIVHNCDAPIFKNMPVAVVGGGNAGLEAAVDLLPYATKIYLLEYGDSLKGDPVTQDKIKNDPKVEIIFGAQTKEILGDQMVSGLKYLDRKTNQEKQLEVKGVFVEIGSIPNSEMVKGLVEIDKYGQVIIDSKHATTSHPGIFAAGDITDDPYKQNNISAGDAVKATLAAYAYLLKREKTSPAAG